MRVYWSLFIAGLLVLGASSAVIADGGYIDPAHSSVSVYEPGQKAIVAWNGEQEVLILSVDVWSPGNNNWVLELVPFPSLPTVEAGSFESFENLEDIIWGYMYDVYTNEGGREVGVTAGENFTVVFQENIGAHYITVTHATSAQSLISFAQNLWITHMGPGEFSWTRLESLAATYIGRGVEYWAIDLLNLSDYAKSREPLVYTFKNDYLYFPLEISSLGAGETIIQLYTIIPENTDNYPILENAGLSKGSFWMGYGGQESHENFSMEFAITQSELGQISPKVAELFDNGAWLTAWQYHDALAELKGDFKLAAALHSPQTPAAQAQLAGGVSNIPEALLFVLVLALQIEIFAFLWKKKR
jgi:hypothetical protein